MQEAARSPNRTESRRATLLLFTSLGAAALSACTEGKAPASQASHAPVDIKKLQDALEYLSGAVGDLENAVGEFATKECAQAIPDVQSSATNVSAALENLKRLIALPVAS
jgi:hypothetical protein